MKKTLRTVAALILAMALLCVCAFAEPLSLVVDTYYGSIMMSEDGELLTDDGEYDSIYCITYENVDPSRMLYSAMSYGFEIDFGDIEWVDEDGNPLDFEGEDWGEADFATYDDEWETGEDEDIIDLEDEDFEEYFESEDYSDGEEPLCALLNSKGELLTDFVYSSFVHDTKAACVYATKADGFVDVLDESGNVLLSGNYSSVVSDCAGGYFAAEPELDKIDEYGEFSAASPLHYISADGTDTDTGYYVSTSGIGEFGSGYLCASIYDADVEYEPYYFGEEEDDEEYYFMYLEDNGTVFINTDGENAFNAVYSDAYAFKSGYAQAFDEEYVGYLINENGEAVTDIKYSDFDFGESETAPILANITAGGFELLDRTTLETVLSFDTATYGENLYAMLSNDCYIVAYSDTATYIFDIAGNLIYTGEASETGDVNTWYSYNAGAPERLVITEGVWPEANYSLIDLDGNVIAGGYQELTPLTWHDGKGRFMTASFETTEEEWEDETYLEPDYETYRYGIIDENGNIIRENVYTQITALSIDRFWTFDDTTYSLIDENGNVLFEMDADYEFDFEEDEEFEDEEFEED